MKRNTLTAAAQMEPADVVAAAADIDAVPATAGEDDAEGEGERSQVPAELTVYHAAALAFELRRQLEAGVDLELDLAGVTELDSAGVQVLLVAAREARARGLRLVLRQPSQVVREALQVLELTETLCPSEEAR